MFAVPESSSPPSTPDRKKRHFSPQHPSTTPIGPPPTSYTAASTTPTGPPPSSTLGSFPKSDRIPPPVFAPRSRAGGIQNGSPRRQTPRRARAGLAMEVDEREEEDDMGLMDYPVFNDGAYAFPGASKFAKIAMAFKSSNKLVEADQMICQTEKLLERLSSFTAGQTGPSPSRTDSELSSTTQALIAAWHVQTDRAHSQSNIGPPTTANGAQKAAWVASLVFTLRNPPPVDATRQSLLSRDSFPSIPIPLAIVRWLREFHNPFPSDINDMIRFQPNPTASERYWDVLVNTTLRGNLQEAINLLRSADFREAVSSLEDGNDNIGYEAQQLADTQRVVSRLIQVLETCPSVESHDWDTTSSDWAIWRKKVEMAWSDLESFAQPSEGGVGKLSSGPSRGRQSGQLAFSQMAFSRVPAAIYSGLTWIYGILTGLRSEVTAAANDWLEATLASAIWWDGEDVLPLDDLSNSHSRARRQRGARLVDTHPVQAYQRALSELLTFILAEDEEGTLQVNPTSVIEVGLATALEGDMDALLQVLRYLSPVVAAASAEVGALSGWLPSDAGSSKVPPMLDASDLMVLSYAQDSKEPSRKDDVLISYAKLLSGRDRLDEGALDHYVEGWQLAVTILDRLDDQDLASQKMSEIMQKLDLTNNERVDKAVSLCTRLGLSQQAQKISERFADRLVSSSSSYGSAIMHYAQALAEGKLRELLNYLITCAVIRSAAFPTPATQADAALQDLLTQPQLTVDRLSRTHPEAAFTLSSCLAGYATLLRFYILRDPQSSPLQNTIPMRPVARKMAAANALISLIQSAADSIHGGLFDAEVASAVPVDALLCLLGEALPFLGDSDKRWFSSPQLVVILTAIENLVTAPGRVRESCEECFVAAIRDRHGVKGDAGVENMLKKSVSSLSARTAGSAGSSFEIIGSGLLRGEDEGAERADKSKGWDWRSGFGADVKGEEMLRILRYRVAQEMGTAWSEE